MPLLLSKAALGCRVYKSDTNLMGVLQLICGMGHAQIKGAHL